VFDNGTGVSWLTGNERVGIGVEVGVEGISVAVPVGWTCVAVAIGALSEGIGGMEGLQDEISVPRIKIVANIFFNGFLRGTGYKYQNVDDSPACLKISATCSMLRP